MTPDDDMDDDVRSLLTGIIVTVQAHKTGYKGAAEVWLSDKDQVMFQALDEVNGRYAKQIGKEYPLSSPIFVNKNLDPFKSTRGKRVINFGRYAKIAGVARYKSHDSRYVGFCFFNPVSHDLFRHVWSAALADQHDLIFREAVALAANHSVATQQKHYVSNFTNKLKKVSWLQFNIHDLIWYELFK